MLTDAKHTPLSDFLLWDCGMIEWKPTTPAPSYDRSKVVLLMWLSVLLVLLSVSVLFSIALSR